MKNDHVTEAFADWSAQALDTSAREQVDRHLSSCTECAAYYNKMSALMDAMAPSALPALEPDPYLPARVRASAGATGGRRAGMGWLRVAFSGAAFAFAIAFGVYVGHGAATSVTASSVEVAEADASSDVFDDYYDALSQSGFAEDWSQWEGDDSR